MITVNKRRPGHSGCRPVARPDPGRILPRHPMPSILALLIMALAGSLASTAARAASDCAGVRFDILTPGLASTPYVVLKAGGRTGPWLVDFGSTITSVYADAVAAPASGEPAPLFAFALPGFSPAPKSLPVVPGGHSRQGVGSPIGTLGTDILRNLTTEIHFEESSDPHVIFTDPACPREPPSRAGYSRTGQAGLFSAHPETHTSNLPNVPVLFIALEERSTDRQQPRLPDPKWSPATWAQIDTGYADSYWPYSVDINEAYLALLKGAVPSLTRAGLVPVSGCGQEDTLREVYVAPGWRLNIQPDMPQRPIPFDSFYLVVKPKVTACGGIGPMPAPAAQLGASFLRAFGTTLIMPAQGEVWIRRPSQIGQ